MRTFGPMAVFVCPNPMCKESAHGKPPKKIKKFLKTFFPVAFRVRSVSDTCYRKRQGRFRNGKEGDGDYSADGGCSDVLVGYKCNILPEAHDRPRTSRLPERYGRQPGPCDMELRSQRGKRRLHGPRRNRRRCFRGGGIRFRNMHGIRRSERPRPRHLHDYGFMIFFRYTPSTVGRRSFFLMDKRPHPEEHCSVCVYANIFRRQTAQKIPFSDRRNGVCGAIIVCNAP